MDKRQQKSRKLIIDSFSKLLTKKSYNQITVQDIIEEANIGRSTFYAHFETKDELLNSMCNEIFEHIFSSFLSAEKDHDFSNKNTLASKLTHLLYHLKENQSNIVNLLTGESSDIFMHYFKLYLSRLFSKYEIHQDNDIPSDFVINYYVSSFGEAIKWWVNENMKSSPEKIVEYYFSLSK